MHYLSRKLARPLLPSIVYIPSSQSGLALQDGGYCSSGGQSFQVMHDMCAALAAAAALEASPSVAILPHLSLPTAIVAKRVALSSADLSPANSSRSQLLSF